jgi:hypothetical protein
MRWQGDTTLPVVGAQILDIRRRRALNDEQRFNRVTMDCGDGQSTIAKAFRKCWSGTGLSVRPLVVTDDRNTSDNDRVSRSELLWKLRAMVELGVFRLSESLQLGEELKAQLRRLDDAKWRATDADDLVAAGGRKQRWMAAAGRVRAAA